MGDSDYLRHCGCGSGCFFVFGHLPKTVDIRTKNRDMNDHYAKLQDCTDLFRYVSPGSHCFYSYAIAICSYI